MELDPKGYCLNHRVNQCWAAVLSHWEPHGDVQRAEEREGNGGGPRSGSDQHKALPSPVGFEARTLKAAPLCAHSAPQRAGAGTLSPGKRDAPLVLGRRRSLQVRTARRSWPPSSCRWDARQRTRRSREDVGATPGRACGGVLSPTQGWAGARAERASPVSLGRARWQPRR